MTELLTKIEAVIDQGVINEAKASQIAQVIAKLISSDLIGLNILDRPAPYKYLSTAERMALAERSTRIQAQNDFRNRQRKMLGL